MFHVHELGELVIMAVVSKLIQIQCNPCQNPNDFFCRKTHLEIHMTPKAP